jgi:hypothetical protein
MTRGNQRELARAKNQKKQETHGKQQKADNKDGNKGLSLQERKQRDADRMRDKQKKAEGEGGAEGGATGGATA